MDGGVLSSLKWEGKERGREESPALTGRQHPEAERTGPRFACRRSLWQTRPLRVEREFGRWDSDASAAVQSVVVSVVRVPRLACFLRP